MILALLTFVTRHHSSYAETLFCPATKISSYDTIVDGISSASTGTGVRPWWGLVNGNQGNPNDDDGSEKENDEEKKWAWSAAYCGSSKTFWGDGRGPGEDGLSLTVLTFREPQRRESWWRVVEKGDMMKKGEVTRLVGVPSVNVSRSTWTWQRKESVVWVVWVTPRFFHTTPEDPEEPTDPGDPSPSPTRMIAIIALAILVI